MKNSIIIFFLLLSLFSRSQVNQFGYPLHKYYGIEELGSSAQNWDVVKAENGLIYLANNLNGIIEYDGESAKHILIEGNPEVRSLSIDNNGRIFVGCSDQFGFLKINSLNGNYWFNNLSNRLPDSIRYFTAIYNVNCIDELVYYSDNEWRTYVYDFLNDSLGIINNPKATLFTFNVNNSLYGGSYFDGIFKTESRNIELISGGDFFKKKNVFSMLDMNNTEGEVAVITGKSGIFKLSLINGLVKSLLTNASLEKMQSSILYAGDYGFDNIILGTIGNGIVVVNQFGEIESIFGQKVGINDNICSKVNLNDKIIFGTLTTGLIDIEYFNPIRYFGKESNLSSHISSIASFNNNIYVGTDIGLLGIDFASNNGTFHKYQGMDNQVYSIECIDDKANNINKLVIGTSNGLFYLDEKNQSLISINEKLKGVEKLFSKEISEEDLKKTTINVKEMYYSRSSGLLWIGTLSRLIPVSYKRGEWNIEEPLIEIGNEIESIIEDERGNLWIETNRHGLFYYNFSSHTIESKSEMLDLGNKTSIKIRRFKDGILLLSSDGEGKLIYGNDSVRKVNLFKRNNFQIKDFRSLTDTSILVNYVNSKTSFLSSFLLVGDTLIENRNYLKRLSNVKTETFHEFKNRIWFTNGSTLYNFPLDAEFEMDSIYHCLVRKVEGYDTVYFNGTYYKDSEVGRIPSMVQHENQKPILEYEYNDLTFHYAAPFFEGVEHIEYSYRLKGFKESWSKWNKEPKAVFTNINEGKYTFQVKAKNVYDIESTVGEYSFTIHPPWYRTIMAYLLYVILGIVALYVFIKLYTRRLQKEKEWLEGVVQERTAEIREQKEEIEKQKEEITSSIHYAQRIQKAIVPSEERAACVLRDLMLLWNPRDIVSGDFWWMGEQDNYVVVTAADCTGHGVPGAFMSMLGVSFLNEIVKQQGITESHEILNRLRDKVKTTLGQTDEGSTNKDGMDIALLVIDFDKMKVQFSGAYNPLFLYRNGELIETKATRNPIGVYVKEKPFEQNLIDVQKGDVLYMFSDGFPDQFGGEKEKKYSTKRFKQLLLDIHTKPMDEQKEILNKEFTEWRGPIEQIDDVIILGIRM